jgi:uncharacterized protein (TIGR02246 family)
MKKIISALAFLLTTGFIFAQHQKEDEISINKQIDAMIYSWNNHNYDNLKDYTTENTDWVNVIGEWWKGRIMSQDVHQKYHDTFLKESRCEKKSVTIRFIKKDVAIVHLYWYFTAIPDPLGQKEPGSLDCLATLVYVNQKGKWLMEAGENVTIVQVVKQEDQAIQKPKD